MRDVLIVSIVLVGAIAALRRPWIGVMLWTWLSLMNPHRYAWGFAYDAPLAAIAAGSTLLGLLMTPDKRSPFNSTPVAFFVMLMLWMTLSWVLGLDPAGDYEQWSKVIKIDVMVLVALSLLHTKKHVLAFVWVTAGSLALLGVKGGLFTLAMGGNYLVWGPPGSFIGDNNGFALALIATIPLLRFLQTQLEVGWKRHAMSGVMLLCAASAVGSHSRGALLAIVAMAWLLWVRGKQWFKGGLVIVAAAGGLLAFMPESWFDRMSTLGHSFEEDRSALGRVSAWWNAWGIGKDYLLGVGFNQEHFELFAKYSPYPDVVTGPHSIYFQMLGNHGFVGLFLFLGVMATTYVAAGRLRREAQGIPEAAWCERLASMCQVALVGYMVGGAFLALSYFDLPYNIMVMVVVARLWLRRQGWKSDPAPTPGWWRIPGLVSPGAPR